MFQGLAIFGRYGLSVLALAGALVAGSLIYKKCKRNLLEVMTKDDDGRDRVCIYAPGKENPAWNYWSTICEKRDFKTLRVVDNLDETGSLINVIDWREGQESEITRKDVKILILAWITQNLDSDKVLEKRIKNAKEIFDVAVEEIKEANRAGILVYGSSEYAKESKELYNYVASKVEAINKEEGHEKIKIYEERFDNSEASTDAPFEYFTFT